MVSKKNSVTLSDYGAQALGENENTFRGSGFVRKADGAFVVLDLRGEGSGKARRARVVTQAVTDRYYFANPAQITWRQWEASNMIRATWSRMKIDGIRTVNLEGLSGGRPAMTEGMMDARKNYGAMKKQLGVLERVIYWCCCANASARDFGKQEGLGRTDGMGILRYALTALANFYSLPHRRD